MRRKALTNVRVVRLPNGTTKVLGCPVRPGAGKPDPEPTLPERTATWCLPLMWAAWLLPRWEFSRDRARLWSSGPDWRKRRRYYWRNRLVTEPSRRVRYRVMGLQPVMGGATIVGSATGGNYNATTAWVGGVVPGAADNVQLASTSGNITVTSGAACRSLDCTGYTGTLSSAASIALGVGDATAGTSNIALKLVAGMTLNANLLFNFASTSATQQTVDFAGKTTNTVDFGTGASAGSWKLTGTVTVNPLLRHTRGTLDLNGQAVTAQQIASNNTNTRTLTMGSSTLTLTNSTGGSLLWNSGLVTGFTLNANTSTIVLQPTANCQVDFGSKAVNNLTVNPPTQRTISNVGGVTVNGTLTMTGVSATAFLSWNSSVTGTARTITLGASSSVSLTDVIFTDTTFSGTGTPVSGTRLGNGYGNTGITFSTRTLYWIGDGGNMSDTAHYANTSGGAGGVALPQPQDTVVFDANSFNSAGQTVTADMTNLTSVDWSAIDQDVTWAMTVHNSYGTSVVLSPRLTATVGTFVQTLARAAITWDQRGASWTGPLSVIQTTGTLTLASALNVGTGSFTVGGAAGVSRFNANGYNVTAAAFSTGALAHVVTMGSGTWTVTGTGTVWNIGATTNLTVNTSKIVIADTSATTKTFQNPNADLVYYDIEILGGAGTVILNTAKTTGTPLTFHNITIHAPASVQFKAGATTAIQGDLIFLGTSSSAIINIRSSSSPTAAIISKASGAVIADWLSVRDSTATGGAAWLAGSNSTNVANNTGWSFLDPILMGTSFEGVGDLGAATSVEIQQGVGFEGTSDLGASQSLEVPVAVSLEGVGDLGAGLIQETPLSVEMGGLGDLGAGLASEATLGATWAGSGDFGANAGLETPLAADFVGVGDFGGDATIETPIHDTGLGVTMTGSVDWQVPAPMLEIPMRQSLLGKGDLVAALLREVPLRSHYTGVGDLDAALSVDVQLGTSLEGSGDLSVGALALDAAMAAAFVGAGDFGVGMALETPMGVNWTSTSDLAASLTVEILLAQLVQAAGDLGADMSIGGLKFVDVPAGRVERITDGSVDDGEAGIVKGVRWPS